MFNRLRNLIHEMERLPSNCLVYAEHQKLTILLTRSYPLSYGISSRAIPCDHSWRRSI